MSTKTSLFSNEDIHVYKDMKDNDVHIEFLEGSVQISIFWKIWNELVRIGEVELKEGFLYLKDKVEETGVSDD